MSRERDPISHPQLSSPGLDRAIQYAAASRLKHRRLWNTGSPAFADDDTESVAIESKPILIVILAFARTTNGETGPTSNPYPSRQLPSAAQAKLLVGLQARHREQMVKNPKFVALSEFGEFGRGGCDQDQGVIRAARPARLLARRSPPAGCLFASGRPLSCSKGLIRFPPHI
ncbi:hypothetical protein [Bradyrhizobium sp. USDA 4454]